MGSSAMPLMPRFPAILLTKELALSVWLRLRLQFRCVFSISFGDQLWVRPRSTLWLSEVVRPRTSRKALSVSWREELKL